MSKVFHFNEVEIPASRIREFFRHFQSENHRLHCTGERKVFKLLVKVENTHTYYFYFINTDYNNSIKLPEGKVDIYHESLENSLIGVIKEFKISCKVTDSETGVILDEYYEGNLYEEFKYELNEGALLLSIDMLLDELNTLIDVETPEAIARITEIENTLTEYQYALERYSTNKR